MATNSVKSNALEPTRAELAQLSPIARVIRLLPVYGLVVMTVLLAAFFSLILPETFPTLLNVRSIVSDKAIIAILSLAVMIPMVTGKIDLTIGYGIVLWHILAISLQVWYGLPWPVAALIVLALGSAVGFLNGILVEIAQIDSFIATLGTGTVLYAVAMWHSQGRQIIGQLPDGFFSINGARLFGMPVTGFYVMALAVTLWFVLEYLPIGRYFYAIGANPKAAALNGIPVRRYTIAAFVCSGLLDGGGGRHPGLQAAHRSGERRPRVPAARSCRRLSRVDHDQAWTRQCVGHARRRRHSGHRHIRDSATGRLVLGRTPVQRPHASGRHRNCGLRATQARNSRALPTIREHPRRNCAADIGEREYAMRRHLFLGGVCGAGRSGRVGGVGGRPDGRREGEGRRSHAESGQMGRPDHGSQRRRPARPSSTSPAI